jgi:hypothetical protein
MDSVRFGRALGRSARGLFEAANAATAPNPNPAPQTPVATPAASLSSAEPVPSVARTIHTQRQAVSANAGRLGRSLFAPFARAGRALWLEVTGTFFALFAAYFISAAWKFHDAARSTATNATAHRHFLGATATAIIFLYFTVSSFVRARRISRAPR